MREDRFVEVHEAEWASLNATLNELDSPRAVKGRPEGDPAAMPAALRRVSQHLALARHRGYTPALVERLHELTMRSHLHLYRPRLDLVERLRELLTVEIPQAVRREGWLVLAGHLLFYGPLLAAFLVIGQDPSAVELILDPQTISQMESMYDPASDHYLRERAVDSDLLMFGFYVWNNVGIGFRTFASGAALGLGPVFFLAYNGLTIGAVASHLHNVGMSGTLSAFVVGHGSFELTAIVLAGAAGGRLGLGLLAPGPYQRGEALRRAALRALPVIQGAGLMLIAAAVIEAFWSSSAIVPPSLKYTVGAALWLLVYAWLAFGGRRAD